MPIYHYCCIECGNIQEETCSISKFKKFKPLCNKCGKKCAYKPVISACQFILRDGPSGSWPSKGDKIKRQRIEASQDAASRQKKRFGNLNTKAIPNYHGNEASDWTEAKEMAIKDVGVEKAAAYDFKIAEERKSKVI